MSKLGSNNETDSLEEFFSDRLKNESMQPSEQVWQHIEGSLRQDKKRKRRFIWLIFCGLIFIGGGISTYVFMNDFMNVKNDLTISKTNYLKSKTTIAAADKKIDVETTEKKTIINENSANTKADITAAKENTIKEEKINVVKIQLGAFKKQVDKAIFDKTGLDIKQETNENGITRYYAEVPENEKQAALQKVQQAGFVDAFIKKNTLLAVKNDEVRSVKSINQSSENKTNIVVAKNKEVKNTIKNTEPSSTKLNVVVAPTKNTNTASSQTKNTNADLPLANNATMLKNETDKNENVKNTTNETKQAPSDEVVAVSTNTISVNKKEDVKTTTDETKQILSNEVAATNTVSETSKSPEETRTEPEVVKQNDAVARTDTAAVAAINTDSTKMEDKKKDEPVVAKANADSLPPTEKMSRWALLLTGGPNFFMKNTSNSLFNTTGEKQPTTYNASLKVEYRLLKKIAISLGLNYSYFTAQQDATLFYFDKNQTTDFIFYSSYGPMAVDMNTMMQGFNPAPWITTLKASYSYTSKINTLQVPIEAKWYFVNGKRINLYTALGGSGMFVVSEQTNLSVIKEHVTNNISYNQVNTSKFNALLMLGLGGDVRLYKKLYFTVDGGFRYGAINLSNTAGIKTNPTYFSVNGGLKVKF